MCLTEEAWDELAGLPCRLWAVVASDQLETAELTWLELARECSCWWEWPEDGRHASERGLCIGRGGTKVESGFTWGIPLRGGGRGPETAVPYWLACSSDDNESEESVE